MKNIIYFHETKDFKFSHCLVDFSTSYMLLLIQYIMHIMKRKILLITVTFDPPRFVLLIYVGLQRGIPRNIFDTNSITLVIYQTCRHLLLKLVHHSNLTQHVL